MFKQLVLFCAVMLTGAGVSLGQGEKPRVEKKEHRFIMEASQGGLLEVKLGQLATEKASSPDVKQFGERMVTDHSKVNAELAKLAEQKGLTPPTQLDEKHQRQVDDLAKLSGAKFDRQYMETMVKDHEKDVKEFEHEAKHSKDTDVKNFAGNTLPTLQEHLQLAKNLEKKVKE